MRDRNFRMLVSFTLVYGVFALAMLAAQPHTPGGIRAAESGGNFEAGPAEVYGFSLRIASAE